MITLKPKILLFLLFLVPYTLFGQEENPWDAFLEKEVVVENPVYKPVIGFGTGLFNFIGDVKNDFSSPITGQLGYKVNVATFVDNNNYVRADFYFLTGSLTGFQRNKETLDRSLNFKTDLFNFGIDLNYSFKNFYKKERRLYPFVSVGVETFLFSSKWDRTYNDPENGVQNYYYWSDGTIRNIPESNQFIRQGRIISRDYDFETDIREVNVFDKKYPAQNYSFAIPVDVGIELSLSYRVTLRLGSSIHFTFTDFLDNLSGTYNEYQSKDPLDPWNGVNFGGDIKNDKFIYTYATLHLDLFSEDKVVTMRSYLAEIESDPTLIGDEDYDMVLDLSDQCLGTPYGVEVDTVGCPLDDDKDGVPNYLDKEPGTAKGAIVDESGVTMSESELSERLSAKDAVNREDVDLIILNYTTKLQYRGFVQVPPKFYSVDKDSDGYISFEEVLDAIDGFFDDKSKLSSKDIYELNGFFFSQ